jgi:hypothetical protein
MDKERLKDNLSLYERSPCAKRFLLHIHTIALSLEECVQFHSNLIMLKQQKPTARIDHLFGVK